MYNYWGYTQEEVIHILVMHRLPTFTHILGALIDKYLLFDVTDNIIMNTLVDSVDNLNNSILC